MIEASALDMSEVCISTPGVEVVKIFVADASRLYNSVLNVKILDISVLSISMLDV